MSVAVTVDLCGRLADAHGPVLDVEIEGEVCTVGDLRRRIAQEWPGLADAILGPRVRACLAETMVDDAAPVRAGDRPAFFPPVSGG